MRLVSHSSLYPPIKISPKPVTNKDYVEPIFRLLGDNFRYVSVRLSQGKFLFDCLQKHFFPLTGHERKSLEEGDLVPTSPTHWLFRLNPFPSPDGFDGLHEPVVNVTFLEASFWAQLQECRLLTQEEMLSCLTVDSLPDQSATMRPLLGSHEMRWFGDVALWAEHHLILGGISCGNTPNRMTSGYITRPESHGFRSPHLGFIVGKDVTGPRHFFKK